MQFVKGDLLKCKESFLVHGCNNKRKMGAGLAKQIRSSFPKTYEYYVKYLNTFSDSRNALGTQITTFESRNNYWFAIGNLITQDGYGFDKKRYANTEWIKSALIDFIEANRKFAVLEKQHLTIASPKIGCNLGGLNWTEVEPIYKEIESKYDVQFTIYEL